MGNLKSKMFKDEMINEKNTEKRENTMSKIPKDMAKSEQKTLAEEEKPLKTENRSKNVSVSIEINKNSAILQKDKKRKQTAEKKSEQVEQQEAEVDESKETSSEDDSSEDSELEVENLDDLEEFDVANDEFSDVESMSGDSGEEAEEEGDSEEEIINPKKKQKTKKRNKTVAIDEFFGGISAILSQQVPESSIHAPIMAKNRTAENLLEESKLKRKRMSELRAEKRLALARGHMIPDITGINHEKALRKIATRGVIQLFNAINTAQKPETVTKVDNKPSDSDKYANMTKTGFLDLLKADD